MKLLKFAVILASLSFAAYSIAEETNGIIVTQDYRSQIDAKAYHTSMALIGSGVIKGEVEEFVQHYVTEAHFRFCVLFTNEKNKAAFKQVIQQTIDPSYIKLLNTSSCN